MKSDLEVSRLKKLARCVRGFGGAICITTTQWCQLKDYHKSEFRHFWHLIDRKLLAPTYIYLRTNEKFVIQKSNFLTFVTDRRFHQFRMPVQSSYYKSKLKILIHLSILQNKEKHITFLVFIHMAQWSKNYSRISL